MKTGASGPNVVKFCCSIFEGKHKKNTFERRRLRPMRCKQDLHRFDER